MSLLERIQKKITVDPITGCWVWSGVGDRQGYSFYCGQLAHRLVYKLLVGETPDGFDLHHRIKEGICTHRGCVNPEHLKLLSHGEHSGLHNVLGEHSTSKREGRYCGNFHEYTEENTYLWVDKKTGKTLRYCRQCRRDRDRLRNT